MRALLRALLTSVALLSGGVLFAQELREPRPDAFLEQHHFVLGGEKARLLEQARAHLAAEQWNEAFDLLEKLLHSDDALDGLIPADPSRQRFTSVHEQARRDLSSLGPKGRAAFLSRSSAATRHLLEQARIDGGESLHTLVRDFPGTPAAAKAASALLERAVEQGAAAEARALAHLPSTVAPLETASLGLRARSALPAPERFERATWSRETFDFYEGEDGHEGGPVPVTDGLNVYVHDGSHAQALDTASGLLLWRTPLDAEDAFKRPAGPCRVSFGGAFVACVGGDSIAVLDRCSGRLLWQSSLRKVQSAAKLEVAARLRPYVVLAQDTVVCLLETGSDWTETYAVGLASHDGRVRFKTFLGSEPPRTPPGSPASLLVGDGARVFVLTAPGFLACLDGFSGAIVWIEALPPEHDEGAEAGRGPLGAARPRLHRRRPYLTERDGRVVSAPERRRSALVVASDTGEVLEEFAPFGRARVIATTPRDLVLVTPTKVLAVASRREVHELGKLPDDFALQGAPAVHDGVIFLPATHGVLRADLGTGAMAWIHSFGPKRRGGELVATFDGAILVSTANTLQLFSSRPPDDAAALPSDDARTLVDLLGSPNDGLRRKAFESLASRPLPPEVPRAQASLCAERSARARQLVRLARRRERIASWRPRLPTEWLAGRPDLLERLTHPAARVRQNAVSDLNTLPEVQPLLRELADDPDSRVSATASVLLLEGGDRSHVATVARALLSRDADDRLLAARALAFHGSVADLALLDTALDDPEPAVRRFVFETLFETRDPLKLGPRALVDTDWEIRALAVRALAKASPRDAAIPLLQKAALDTSAFVATEALKSLGSFRDPRCYEAIGDVALKAAGVVQREAIDALHKIARSDDARRLPKKAIEAGLAHEDERVRHWFLQVFEEYFSRGGTVSAEALARGALATHEAIVSAGEPTPTPGDETPPLSNPLVGLRHRLLDALFTQVQDATPTPADVAAISSLVRVKDREVRYLGYQIVSRTETDRRPFLLAQGLLDSDSEIQALVRERLPRALDADAVAVVASLASHVFPQDRRDDARGILKTAPLDAVAPGLLRCLETGDTALRTFAWAVLSERANQGWSPLPVPPAGEDFDKELLRAKAWWWRQKAALDAPSTTAALLADLVDKNPNVRFKALRALRGFMPTKTLVHALASALESENVPWLEKEGWATAEALAGKTFGWRAGLAKDERARLVAELRAWGESRR